MGLRINTLLATKANTQLQRTQKAIARSLERLSTGQRVNSPRDDARAYALGVGLNSQIRGIAAANLGLNSAIGMIDTASAGIATQLDIVSRMREIAVQASNGTLTDAERGNLNSEVQSLYSEFVRITTQTNFNGKNLLDGTFSPTQLQAGSRAGDRITLNMTSTQASGVFIQRLTVGDGTFLARTTLTTGNYPHTGKVADVNGDGKVDVLAASSDSDFISLSLGNGNGTFLPTITIATGTYPIAMQVIDINLDGKMDLIVADGNNATVSIFRGNGNGTFQPRTTVEVTYGGHFGSVDLADLNGDGKLDMITDDSSSYAIALGNGDGTFKTRTSTGLNANTISTNSSNLTFVDLNGDGKQDVFQSYNQTGTYFTFALGNGNGTFTAKTTIATQSYPAGATTGDVNGDGLLDIVITDDGFIDILIGNGNGTFQTRKTIAAGDYPLSVITLDVNGDGKLDIAMADSGNDAVGILLGNGNGTFLTRKTYTAGSFDTSINAADFNGDGVLDLVLLDTGADVQSILIANSTSVSSAATISVTTQTKAQNLISALDYALSYLSTAQANLGAIHSRLNETISGNLLLSENLGEARSLTVDTDYAVETAEIVRNQILQAAQVAVLAQANLQTQLSLKLLEDLT